jgi:hypothetical protein
MLVAFLAASEVALIAASFALVIAWHEPGLAWLASGLASVCALAAGFAAHSTLIKVLGAAAIAAWLTNLGRPRKRRQLKQALGAKSAAIRARLTARMRGAAAPRPSPSPP